MHTQRTNKTLRQIVDELPTESLELYADRFEAGQVFGYWGEGYPFDADGNLRVVDTCPRCSLGFGFIPGVPDASVPTIQLGTPIHEDHPAYTIEMIASDGDLDRQELYEECILAIAERDHQILAMQLSQGEADEVRALRDTNTESLRPMHKRALPGVPQLSLLRGRHNLPRAREAVSHEQADQRAGSSLGMGDRLRHVDGGALIPR